MGRLEFASHALSHLSPHHKGDSHMTLTRRALTWLATLSVAIAVAVAGVGSPALASTKCSFVLIEGSHYKTIRVNCNGNIEASADVVVTAYDTYYKVQVADYTCDNIGPYWHAWATGGGQYKYGAGGCHNHPTYTVYMNQIGYPANWWVEFGGANSPAITFPPPL
jgi:hypothetical protein